MTEKTLPDAADLYARALDIARQEELMFQMTYGAYYTDLSPENRATLGNTDALACALLYGKKEST